MEIRLIVSGTMGASAYNFSLNFFLIMSGLYTRVVDSAFIPNLFYTETLLKLLFSLEPLPMKLRALPQSFWQQPNAVNSASPGTMYAVLPPLCKTDQSGPDITGK